MSFKIIIEQASGQEAITELLRVADFYRNNPSLSSGAVVAPTADAAVTVPATDPVSGEATTAVVVPRTTRTRPAKIAPPAGSAAQQSSPPGGSAEAVPGTKTEPVPGTKTEPTAAPLLTEPTVSLTEARAYLSPHLSDPTKSPKVVAIIKQFSPNGRLSEVPEGDLPKLLAATKAELEVA